MFSLEFYQQSTTVEKKSGLMLTNHDNRQTYYIFLILKLEQAGHFDTGILSQTGSEKGA